MEGRWGGRVGGGGGGGVSLKLQERTVEAATRQSEQNLALCRGPFFCFVFNSLTNANFLLEAPQKKSAHGAAQHG